MHLYHRFFGNKKPRPFPIRAIKFTYCVRYALKPQLILYTTILLASCQQNNSKNKLKIFNFLKKDVDIIISEPHNRLI
nr:MAG TPA: hypothetical protein [Caudoviricetes sp.]